MARLAAATIIILLTAAPALADDCNVFINPEDCENTAWTVGAVATAAAAAAAATALTRSGTRGPLPRDEGECGAEIHDLDGRLNREVHALETSIDRFNREALGLDSQFARAIRTYRDEGEIEWLSRAKHARRKLQEEALPDIQRGIPEVMALWRHREAVYQHCLSRGMLPQGTWRREAPSFNDLMPLPDWSEDNPPPFMEEAEAEAGVRTPPDHDALIDSLGKPGTTVIDPSNAHNLGPPELVGPGGTIKVPPTAPMWASPLDGVPIPRPTIEGGTVTVDVGVVKGTVRVTNDGGKLAISGTYEVPFGGGNVQDVKRLQKMLAQINQQMREAGMEVKSIDASGTTIRIRTGPIEGGS